MLMFHIKYFNMIANTYYLPLVTANFRISYDLSLMRIHIQMCLTEIKKTPQPSLGPA